MQHVSETPWSPAGDRKIYAVWIGVVWAAVLVGFGMDFARYVGEAPSPPFILNAHGAIYVLWLGLVTLQILWVEMGNLRRHKQLGWLTVAVSVLMVPLGLAAALVDQVRQVTHPDYAPQFLALEFEEVIAFSAFMIAGVILRRNPGAHKRLMLLCAVAISDAGFARIGTMGIPGPFGWWMQYFWGIFLILIAMGAWDLWRWGRIHPAGLFGAALLWTGEIVTTILNFSPAWRDVMVRLVNAWGYAG
ncbi:MAG: hypothetical protein M3N97_09695 [Pseudomonadota bacterium]|nr:hypothetical protein [Pseudomonadota bacterium]